MIKFKRLLRHGFMLPSAVKRYFPASSLQHIEAEIAKSETQHLGEIRFVVESHLSIMDILRKKSAKKRAIEVFSQFHIWDTEQNNGVLIYLLLADHDFEILGDRGIHQHVGAAGWERISQQMEAMFRKGQFEAGVVFGIHQIGEYLSQHFPAQGENENVLPNQAIVI
jgi:uncharacterized membrane protein